MVGKYIIETKNEVIYELLGFYGHEIGPENLKNRCVSQRSGLKPNQLLG